MYLFQHMIVNIDQSKINNGDDDRNNFIVKQFGFIVTDKNFEILNRLDINTKDVVDIAQIENQFLEILESVDILILFETTVTLNILKKYLISNNMRQVIDLMNRKCFYDIRMNLKSVVKKVNRFGVLNPTINDLYMYVCFEEYVDKEDAVHTVDTLHKCCSELYKQNKLKNFDTLVKKNKEKSITKSFKSILSFQSSGSKTLF